MIDSVDKKPNPDNVKFVVDTFSISITEKVVDAIRRDTLREINWINKINYQDIKVDSSGLITNLWMKLDIENMISIDSLHLRYYPHVKAIQIITDSVKASGNLSLNNNIGGNAWSMVALEDSTGFAIQTYEGNFSPLKITFLEDIRSTNQGHIKARMTAEIISNKNYSIILTGNIFMGYKLK